MSKLSNQTGKTRESPFSVVTSGFVFFLLSQNNKTFVKVSHHEEKTQFVFSKIFRGVTKYANNLFTTKEMIVSNCCDDCLQTSKLIISNCFPCVLTISEF